DKISLDITEIKKILLHRYPFLLIDKVPEVIPEESIHAIKNVSVNEDFFNGHFPDRPIMPGVLILEAMAQASALLARFSAGGTNDGSAVFIVGANDVKWKKTVVPGDVLDINMRLAKRRKTFWAFEGEVSVNGNIVTSGTLSAMEVK
ncbi:UNVERIFIED_CONTAM: hypothetical protein GTU68_039305, partial [Idotea baltica]|nr:hypothetical protein [Idotea baltica]